MLLRRKTVILTLTLLAVLALALIAGTSILAVEDGRINEAAHAGGTVIYCVNEAGEVFGDYHTGGIEVLSPDGQVLLFVSGDVLGPLVDQADADELTQNALVGEVEGLHGFGMLDLWVLQDGRFMLTGYDEYGKPFEFAWRGCDPVCPPAPESEDEPAPVVTDEPNEPNGEYFRVNGPPV